MFYSSGILQCIIAICIIEDVIGDHSSKYKIDEFIEKLLVSQKFEQLTEKFAEKAVEKILNLQPNLRITDGSKKDDNIQKTDEKPQINETQKNDLQNDEEKVTPKNISSNQIDVKYKTTSTPIKHLSLQYKHFTKGPSYNKNSDEYDNSKIKRDDTSSDVSTELHNKSQRRETKLKADSDSNQNSIDNTNIKHKDAYKIHEKTRDENEDDAKSNSNEKDGSISTENKRNILEMLIESSSGDHKSNADVHRDGEQSDFETKLKKDRDLFESESQYTSKTTKSKKKRKRRFRKEGTRVYTFVSSSEYDEYHEELDRVEKGRTVFL